MRQALIFDLDGTLVDSLRGIADSLNRALEGMKFSTHPDAAVRGFIGNGARMLVTRAAPAGAGIELLDRLEAAFKFDYHQTWTAGTTVYPEMIELLNDLQEQRVPLAVLSNKPHPFTCDIVRHLFPQTRFSPVTGQRPGLPHKPDPAGALEIAAAWKIAPAACTLIGDSTMDLETAQRAGMKAIGVTWGYHDRLRLAERTPDRLVDAVAGLRVLLGL